MFAFACLALCLLSVGHGRRVYVSPQVEQEDVDRFADLLLMLHPAASPPRAQSMVHATTIRGTQPLMAIDAKMVKELRDASGAGMMDCKKALVESDGDMEKAAEALRNKGLAIAQKKAGREAKEGIIETYVHTGGKLGVMVEINCETDFVAKNPAFKSFARDIAMQIAASPEVTRVSEDDIDPAFIAEQRRIESGAEDLQGKPENIIEKIVDGRVAKIVKSSLLLPQPFIKNSDITVEEYVKQNIAKLGENMKIAHFVRMNVGGSQKKEAEEIEA